MVGSRTTSLLWVALQVASATVGPGWLAAPASAAVTTSWPADEGLLEVGQPRSISRPQQAQAGQQRWRLSVVERQWIALMLVADEATSWTVDTGGSQTIEGCGDESCRWIVVAASPGDSLTVEVRWSADSSGAYQLAAAQPPNGLRGPQATAMRELYTLAEVEQAFRADGEDVAATAVNAQLLSRLTTLSTVDPVDAAQVASVIAWRRFQASQGDIALALTGRVLQHLDSADESHIEAWFSLRGLEANVWMSSGDYAPARQAYLDMDRTAARLGISSVTVNVALSVSTLELLSGHPERGAEQLSQLLCASPARVSQPEERGVLWAALGLAWESAGEPGRAEQAFGRALTLGPDPAHEAQLRVNLGRVLSHGGRSAEARKEFEAALEQAVATRATEAQGSALSGLAWLHSAAGRTAEALAAAEEALTLIEAASPRAESSLSALHTLTGLALGAGEASRARDFIARAEAILEQGNPASLAVLERTGAPAGRSHWSGFAQALTALERSAQDR